MNKPNNLNTLIQNYIKACTPFIKRANSKFELDKLATKIETHFNLDFLERFYCYVYLDPQKEGPFTYILPSGKSVTFSHLPFYFGKGKDDRSKMHTFSFNKQSKSYKNNLLKKLASLHLEPIIKITATKVKESLALALEIDLIAGVGRKDLKTGPLANLTNGGEGVCGILASAETRQKMSNAHINKTPEQKAETNAKKLITFNARTPEQKAKTFLKLATAINNRSPELKLSIQNKINNRTPEQKAETNAKKSIVMLTKTPEQKAKSYAKSLVTKNLRTLEQKIATDVKRLINKNNKPQNEKDIIIANRVIYNNNRTPEEKRITKEKQAIARNLKTPEQKEASIAKGLATKANKKLRTCK